jgi:hypothetical protein
VCFSLSLSLSLSLQVVIGEGVNTLKTYSKVTRYGLATDGREGKTVKTPRQFSSDSEASQSNDEIGSLSRGVTEKSSRRDLIVSRFRDVNLGREGVGRLWVERERQSYVTLLRTLNQNRNPNQPPIEENNFLRHTDLVLSDDIIELLRKTHRSDSTFTTTNGNGDATVGTHSLNQSLITESESESESEIGRVDEIESDEENTTSKKKDLIKSNSSKMYISDLQRMCQSGITFVTFCFETLQTGLFVVFFPFSPNTHTHTQTQTYSLTHISYLS